MMKCLVYVKNVHVNLYEHLQVLNIGAKKVLRRGRKNAALNGKGATLKNFRAEKYRNLPEKKGA